MRRFYFIITCPVLRENLVPALTNDDFGLANIIFCCNNSLIERVFHDINVTLEKHFFIIITCCVVQVDLVLLKLDYFGLANIIFHCNMSIIELIIRDISTTLEKHFS